MKHGIIIVNTARGGVMNEAALVHAIESGRVLSAGLDVYESEPNIHPGLLGNPHVCLLPHMGTSTLEVSAMATSNRRACMLTSIDQDEDGGIGYQQCTLIVGTR